MDTTHSLIAKLQIPAAFVFGLVPSLIIAYFSLKGLMRAPQYLLAGKYFSTLATIGFAVLIFFGVSTLLRYVFGAALKRLRLGSLVGLVGMSILVIWPFANMYLQQAGIYEPRFDGRWDNYGVSLVFAVVSTGPTVVLAFLAYLSRTSKLREADRR